MGASMPRVLRLKLRPSKIHTMRVGVYGLGRFGSFWASELARHFSVKGYSRSQHRKTPDGVERVSEHEIAQTPVLFLCVAISALEEVIGRLSGLLRPGALVLDTCSIKVYPVSLMERLLPAGVEIMATHPMFGPDSAKHGVDGLPLVLWPVRVSDDTLAYWKRFFGSIGLNIVQMTPEEHDREAAFTQGVTHYIGRVVADLGLRESPIGTLGYQKLLQIAEQTCNDPWQLFVDLQRFNPYTRDMRRMLHESLDRIMGELEGLSSNAQD